MDKPKRKTFTSSAVKKRYNDKTYKKYITSFRIVEDADIIALVEAEKSKGLQTTEIFRNLIRKSIKEN